MAYLDNAERTPLIMPHIPPRHPPQAPEVLRERWRSLSESSGWAYPSDWPKASVDALCEALVEGRGPWDAAERLGQERGASGVGLPETLADIDALTTLVPAALAEQLRRGVSLGWSEQATAQQTEIIDPMTGLAILGYLQVRLEEVYRAGAAAGVPVNESHALVMVSVDTQGHALGRRLPMVIVADGIRAVFDGGESLAVLSDWVIAVLCERERRLPRRVALAQSTAKRLLNSDELVGEVSVRSWIEPLPPTVGMATQLVANLSR